MLKDLPALIEAGVITPETAERIREYYRSRSGQSVNRLVLVFGILGAMLVGLGIILILAHNWDDFTRTTKTALSFVPLVLGQALGAFALFKRAESVAWREGSATFLFFAVGACISLISQIYHIQGNLADFLLTWMLLVVPLIYALRSSTVSLLYLLSLTVYIQIERFEPYGTANPPYEYWLLLGLLLPYYYRLCRSYGTGNYATFHHWVLPFSLAVCIGAFLHTHPLWGSSAFLFMLGTFYLLSEELHVSGVRLAANGYWFVAIFAGVGFLISLSFEGSWHEFTASMPAFVVAEILIVLLFMGLYAGLLYRKINRTSLKSLELWHVVPVVYIPFAIIALFASVPAQILDNILVLALGIAVLRKGALTMHLGVLNLGLLIISTLLLVRFFDTDISFALRGVLFLLVGLGFFIANLLILKRRKNLEQ